MLELVSRTIEDKKRPARKRERPTHSRSESAQAHEDQHERLSQQAAAVSEREEGTTEAGSRVHGSPGGELALRGMGAHFFSRTFQV